ncbi:unnamed protein product [Auanema sp. JU1783]|nr:unnamed protein product [Auanema sp. JU1783]
MFANNVNSNMTFEDSVKAQKSQKERQRRERENLQINRLKQFLLDNIPNNPYKLEKADILDQTVNYVYSAKQNIIKLEETLRQQSMMIYKLQNENKQLENNLRDFMSISLINTSPNTNNNVTPDRMISTEIQNDSLNCSPITSSSTSSNLDEMEFSSPETSPAGLACYNSTPHLPRKHAKLRSLKPESVWQPWQ